MAKYLLHASYTTDGVKGLIKDGGSKRRAAAEAAVKSVGGTLEAFYYALGEHDAIVIVDADNVSIAALSLAINATGTVTTTTTALLSVDVEEIDQATKKQVSYRPPGQE